ncbi:MAG: ATP-binding protein [Candidatus Bathyarchaeota archaeon]|nr:MAG: ATP-binding protein [Candidatus Bathyarchaeota archaeon]
MSNHLGSICDVKGDKISFFMKKDANLSFGQIVRVDSGGRSFYARVVNAQSKSTLETGEQLREAEGKETFGPYSCYKNIEAILFLEKRAGKVRSPTFNPNYMDKVFQTTQEDSAVLKLGGELQIGNFRSGESMLGNVGIDSDAIPRMLGMFGMTGSGKTNTELIVNAQLIDHSPQTAGLIFDFAGQLLEGKELFNVGLRDHPLFHSKVCFYSTKAGKMRVGLRTLRPEKLRNLFSDITDPQYRLAQKIYGQLGEEWIEKVCEVWERNGPAGVTKLVSAHKGTINALMQKLTHLNPALFPPSPYSFIDDVIENISQGVTCLVDISGITAEEQHRIVCLTASGVANHYKREWERNYERWQLLPTLLITLEEAHEFLDPARERTIFSSIALTYRKYRVGLNAVTPRPSRINPDVFAELWTKVIMKTELKADRDYLTKNTPYLEYSDTELKMLDIGEALLISEPKIRFAVPVKVVHYADYLKTREKVDYRLPPSKTFEVMGKKLKQLQNAGKSLGNS